MIFVFQHALSSVYSSLCVIFSQSGLCLSMLTLACSYLPEGARINTTSLPKGFPEPRKTWAPANFSALSLGKLEFPSSKLQHFKQKYMQTVQSALKVNRTPLLDKSLDCNSAESIGEAKCGANQHPIISICIFDPGFVQWITHISCMMFNCLFNRLCD